MEIRLHLGILGLTAVLGLLYLAQPSQGCEEAICASLVSKCLLLKSCECNMVDKKNCTCCKDCHRCLAKLYTECCSCVGMCPEQSYKDGIAKTSSVETLTDPIPELFEVLTEEEDPHVRWTTYTYPAHLDLLYFQPRGTELEFGLEDTYKETEGDNNEPHHIRHGRHHIAKEEAFGGMNCTVAYMSKCLSLNQCKASCQSMGAARYRWFHQYGCCECIGSTCLDYGKGEALCHKCPLPAGEEEEEDDYYYYYDDHEQGKYREDGAAIDAEEVDDGNLATGDVEKAVLTKEGAVNSLAGGN